MDNSDDTSPSETSMLEQPHAGGRIPRPCSDDEIIFRLCDMLGCLPQDARGAFDASLRNVRAVLRRQIYGGGTQRPICKLFGEQAFYDSLCELPITLEICLFTVARVWDEAHMKFCKTRMLARKGKPHNAQFFEKACVDLRPLTDGIRLEGEDAIHKKIKLSPKSGDEGVLEAVWEECPIMSFDNLDRLDSLEGTLPGESPGEKNQYAGIGGGGGSDVISASLLGYLLRGHKKQMNLLVSTRTWATGSQGKPGDVIGVRRVVHQHGGPATYLGEAVAGTFLIRRETRAEGRDLESIPLEKDPKLLIYMVLDQGESKKDIPENEQVNLEVQFNAVLSQLKPKPIIVNTGGNLLSVLSVDTGGDVFGTDGTDGTTPDQDLRVQKAIKNLPKVNAAEGAAQERSLITAVVAPGVDAPHDAPEKARKAGGKVYKPTQEEKDMLLRILTKDYRMDGSLPNRFGKTTLALQECLRGTEGWTSLNLPEHVVDTWDNPWSSFVFIQKCMSDIIFMPTKALLEYIDPDLSSGTKSKAQE